ncbi:MAG: carbohydrate ABC transporter permease [Brevibacterium sp.]
MRTQIDTSATSPPRKKRPSRSGNRRRTRTAYVFLAPWFIGVVCLIAVPLVYSLYLSFTDFDVLGSPEWVGLSNYERLFTADQRYLHSLTLTLGYVIVSVPVQLAAALGVALLLAPKRRGQGIYRALFYLPSLLGASVGVSIVWRALFQRSGTIPELLGTFGFSEQSWIDNPAMVVWVIILLEVWKFGAPMVIFIAGLHQIPQEQYEAAALDGAGKFRTFVSITLPALSPVVFFNLVMGVITAFQTFTPAQVVGDGTGGPSDSTLFYAVYLYQKGFQDMQMGYASAISWVMLLILGVIAAILFATSRKWVQYGND